MGLKLRLAAALILGFVFVSAALQTYPVPVAVDPAAKDRALLEGMFGAVWFYLAYTQIQKFKDRDPE